jgi:hypothetical protein
MCTRFREALRLCKSHRCVQFGLPNLPNDSTSTKVAAALHRFEESIAGRPYLIEVAAVADDRWRAYIVRLPGVPTALMPFYGRTPIEAAQLLCDWLSRAHARAAKPLGGGVGLEA